ncbi:MAG: ORF6N domain-containing protein [Bacteroidetes bacterium]|nr:ORF6N domain-containing protein [Bacteroidota bacterium]
MKKTVLLSEEKILNRIYVIRGKKVMLDKDLAEMYGVLTKNLNRAVKRNLRRFPDDFMFRLTGNEFESLRCQFGTSNLEFQSGISNAKEKSAHGGLRTLPYVFTEQGVAMLSSVLNSTTAIDVNIQIIRVFTRMREVFLSQKDLVLKIEKLEKKVLEHNSKVGQHDEEIGKIFMALRRFVKVSSKPMKKIGYKRKNEK